MEEKTTEQQETSVQETGENSSRPGGNQPREISMRTLVMLIAALGVIVVLLMGSFGKGNKEEACVIVQQSPFGQSQQQIWIDLDGDLQAKGIAEFGLSYPDGPEGYDKKIYRVYSKQINSLYYINDDNGKQGMMIVKGKFCGKDVFESGFYNDGVEYAFINKVQDGDTTVTMKGNDSGVQVASWVEGEFSYAIGVWNSPVTEAEMLDLISQTE